MNAVNVTNRLQMQVRRLLPIIETEQTPDALESAFVLLFEQFVCAIVQESCNEFLEAGQPQVLDDLLEEPANVFVRQLTEESKKVGSWVSELLIERAALLRDDKSIEPASQNLIAVNSVTSNLKDYQRWLNEAEAFLASVREFNQEY